MADLQLRSVIRNAVARAQEAERNENDPFYSLDLVANFVPAGINIAIVTLGNVYDQQCIKFLKEKAAEHSIDIRKFQNICWIVSWLWGDLADKLKTKVPKNLTEVDRAQFSDLKMALLAGQHTWHKDLKFYVYGERYAIGDRK